MKRMFLLAFMCLSYSAASAQTPCDRLSERIESTLKDMSYTLYSGILDNSAPRETNRQLKIAAGYSSLQLTLSQQLAAKCKPYLEPISGLEYRNDAVKCTTAKPEEATQLCDRKSWKRD